MTRPWAKQLPPGDTSDSGVRIGFVGEARYAESFCSCGDRSEMVRASPRAMARLARDLAEHLAICPDADLVAPEPVWTDWEDPSVPPDYAMTLDEWREQYG